jgi:hypothetical protein
MSEAKVTLKETNELLEWLRQRDAKAYRDSPSSNEDGSNLISPNRPRAGLSGEDVGELISWLKDRMSDTELTREEKDKFQTWLMSQLRDGNYMSGPEHSEDGSGSDLRRN